MSLIESRDLAVGKVFSTKPIGEPNPTIYKVKSIATVKPGKHGASKVVITATDVFTGISLNVRALSFVDQSVARP